MFKCYRSVAILLDSITIDIYRILIYEKYTTASLSVDTNRPINNFLECIVIQIINVAKNMMGLRMARLGSEK